MADLNEILQTLQKSTNWAAEAARNNIAELRALRGEHAMIGQHLEAHKRDIGVLAEALAKVKVGGGGAAAAGGGAGANGQNQQHGQTKEGKVVYLEDIPGRRIPFDLVVNIPIGANITSEQQATVTISQDGPFVAVARYAAFRSQYQFTKTDPQSGIVASFQGRSFGRWRPIHSMSDVLDSGMGFVQPVAPIAFPGTGAPYIASPSNASPFRSMEFDALIEMLNQGAAYPRSNIPIPSAFWTSDINAAFQLGALDFFERGEVIQYKVTPTHANNPAAGNLSAYGAGGVFPFLDSQYDVAEGINDEQALNVTTDPVQRLPDGILTIGLHGFRIVQPPGPVALT